MKRESFFEFDGLALDLFFCSEILKLSSLHYGLWERPGSEALTLDNLRAAQRRYTEALWGLIPEGTRKVLDVGCGLGDVARGMAARGLSVTAISPDRNHGRYVRSLDPSIRFIQARYQNFSSTERFDLVLMSESQNYFQPDVCFEQTERFLKKSGYLLVSGMFRKKGGKPFPDHVNVVDDFLAHGAARGFQLVVDEDVTPRVLPTLALVHGAVSEYVNPSVELLRRYFETSAPLKARVLSWVFRKQISDLGGIHRYLLAKMDPVMFRENATYRLMLLRREALASAA